MAGEHINFFGLHGEHVQGDDTREQIARGKLLMWHARHLAGLMNVPVYALTQHDGQGGWVRAQIGGPDHRILGAAPQRAAGDDTELAGVRVTRLVWVPEGFMITPRSASAPDGWGLPPTADGRGTPGGPLPMVLINRHEHANYPEYLAEVYADAPGMDAATGSEHFTGTWPPHYRDAEDAPDTPAAERIGAWQGYALLPQFISRWRPLLTEKRQGKWFCHRPQLRKFAFASQQQIFDLTNARRQEASKPKLLPPIKGWTASLGTAVLYEAARAATLAHDSPDFRIGWQRMVQRWRSSFGGNATAGENLFMGDYRADAGLAQSAVAWWRGSAGHDANMARDYTGGADAYGRLWRPETLDVGVWPVTPITRMQKLPSTGWPPAMVDAPGARPLAAQVFVGRQLIDVGRACWRHPDYGAMLLEAGSSAEQMMPLANVVWRTSQAAVFKHQDILVSELTVSQVQTERRQRLLCASFVSAPVTPLPAERIAGWVQAKRAREQAYNARRAAHNIPADTACVGSEDGRDLAAEQRTLKVRALIYEETGPGGQAPNYSTPPTLQLLELDADGMGEGHAAARRVLTTYSLPTSVLELGAQCTASRDGTRVLAAYTTHIPGPTTAFDRATGAIASQVNPVCNGEALHFVEVREGYVIDHGYSRIDVKVTATPARYTQTAKGECNLIGYYDVDTLRFVRMAVDHEGWYTLPVPDVPGQWSRHLRGKLIFFDGTEFEFVRTDGDQATPPNGVVRHIAHLDPLHPERTLYVEYALSTQGTVVSTVTRLMRGIAQPQVLRTIANTTLTTTRLATNGAPWLVALSRAPEQLLAERIDAYAPYPADWPLPATDFAASFWHGSMGSWRPAGYRQYGGDGTWRPRCTPLAPTILPALDGQGGIVRSAQYGADWIVAGVLHDGNVFGPNQLPVSERYFWDSSLDLKAITGVPDLSNNILPIWSY